MGISFKMGKGSVCGVYTSLKPMIHFDSKQSQSIFNQNYYKNAMANNCKQCSIRIISHTTTPPPKAYDCVAVYIAGRRTSLVVYGSKTVAEPPGTLPRTQEPLRSQSEARNRNDSPACSSDVPPEVDLLHMRIERHGETLGIPWRMTWERCINLATENEDRFYWLATNGIKQSKLHYIFQEYLAIIYIIARTRRPRSQTGKPE